MSYNDLITESLANINDRVQSYTGDNNTLHKKCDYIEILALLSSDEIYKNNLKSRFFAEEEDRNEADNIQEEEQAELNDEQEQSLVDFFEILLFRQNMFGENYPFEVTTEQIKLKDNPNQKQKLYIILLCCANLTTFERSLRSKLTDEFEEITYCAFKKYLPGFEIKRLGYKSDYPGMNTRNKLRNLGSDLNVAPRERQINGIPIGANKEKGVDLVAWYKFIDNLPNTMIFLIQCACGKDTEHKIHEPLNYCTYLDLAEFQKKPIITLAVPKAVLIGENKIEQIKDVAKDDSLYFDRLRLLEFCNIEDDMSCIEGINAFHLADKLIDEAMTILD